MPALLLFGGANVLWDVLREKRLPRYVISTHWLEREGDARKLSELRRAGLDWYRTSALGPWTPALRLEVGADVWRLPLALEGWGRFWDCLRKLRPDLGLPDWRRLKPVRAWLVEHRRYNLALPTTVKVRQAGPVAEAATMAIVVGLLDASWKLATGNRTAIEGAFLAAAGVGLNRHLLRRIYPPRIVAAPWLEGEGRTETPSTGR